MVKRLLLFLFIVVLFTSCSFSQVIEPTITPIPTSTVTSTVIPTFTPTPVPLRNLVISHEDINSILSVDIYEPIIVQNEESVDGGDIFEGVFVNYSEFGLVWVTLLRVFNGSCDNINSKMKLEEASKQNTELINTPDEIFLPDNAWMIVFNENNHVGVGFFNGNVCVMLEYEIPGDLNIDDVERYIVLIAQKQYYKLEDTGY